MQKKKKNTCYAEAERKKLESIFVSCKYQSINRIEQPIAFKERTSAPLFRYLNLVKDRRRIDFFFSSSYNTNRHNNQPEILRGHIYEKLQTHSIDIKYSPGKMYQGNHGK